jgi:hypothetical protein
MLQVVQQFAFDKVFESSCPLRRRRQYVYESKMRLGVVYEEEFFPKSNRGVDAADAFTGH